VPSSYRELLILSGLLKAGGLLMLRIAPPPGRSSPISHLTPAVSFPAPFVRSTNSPKTSEMDSLIAPDWNQ
jgi:hypothetical protein